MEVLSSRIVLRSRDSETLTAFYRDTLELAIYREFPGGTVFFLGGGFLEISGQANPGENANTALWLQVRDVAATIARLQQRGVVPDRPVRREPWGLDEAWISDPEGNAIVLVEIPADHPLRVDVRHH